MAAVTGGASATSFLSSKHLHLRRRIPLTVSCSWKKHEEKALVAVKGRRISVKASSSTKTGGPGVLERPAFDQSQFDPSFQVLEGGDIGQLRDKRGTRSEDSYRVLLIDDIRHSENLVMKVIPQVVPSVTPNDARRLFHQSKENGFAVVIVTVKEHAEFYSQMMIRRGLRSSIEPDSNAV